MTTPAVTATWQLVAIAAAYNFFLMAAYFVVKPLRDAMGAQIGASNLPWLWLGTLVSILLILPPYWRLVAAMPRRRFIPWINRTVMATLVGFYLWFKLAPGESTTSPSFWAPCALYVWISVFNLLLLSVFWSFMADGFSTAQSRRLFARIAVGGTIGAILGAWVTSQYAPYLKTTGLLLVSAALLEIATQAALLLARRFGTPAGGVGTGIAARPSLRDWIAGLAGLVRSRYLLAIAGYLFVSIVASTFAYYLRTELVGSRIANRDEQTAASGWIDMATQLIAFLLQALVAARFLKRFGTGRTLAMQMVGATVGFVLLGFALDLGGAPLGGTRWWEKVGLHLTHPTADLLAIVCFSVLLKSIEFGFSKPARETLFTVVTRAEKYQSKSLIDTGLYRFFDQVAIWSFAGLHGEKALGLSPKVCVWIAAPVMLLGLLLSVWLGRAQQQRAAAVATTYVPPLTPA